MVLKHQPEEVPTYAQVEDQLGSNLPVVVDVCTVVVLSVRGEGDVGDEYGIGAPDVRNSIGYGRCRRSQQDLRTASVASAHLGDVRIDAVKIELPSRPGRLQGRELDVLTLETHLESMFAVNFREVVGDLNR